MIKLNNKYIVKGAITKNLIDDIIDSARNTSIGAHEIFLGQVRADNFSGKIVSEIEYSAYNEMVKLELEKIFSEISTKYTNLQQLKVIHSIGVVKAGEYSLLVFVGAGHRKNVFLALDDIVNLIKERVPIWKKEILEDKTYIWTKN